METNKLYQISEQRTNFCCKTIKLSKLGRIVTPVIFLVANYLFVYSFFETADSTKILIIYWVFSCITTLLTYLISTSSIRRYESIVKEIKTIDGNIFEVITISLQILYFNKNKCQIENSVLVVNRNNKFEDLIIDDQTNKIILVPIWFEDLAEIKGFFDNPRSISPDL